MMLAEAEEIDIKRIRQHGFVGHVSDDLGVRNRDAVGRGRHITERIQSEFKIDRHFNKPPFVKRVHYWRLPSRGNPTHTNEVPDIFPIASRRIE